MIGGLIIFSLFFSSQLFVFGIEKYSAGHDISISVRKFGMWIRYLDISYLVISHDMGYYITIYHDILCDITPSRLETPDKHN